MSNPSGSFISVLNAKDFVFQSEEAGEDTYVQIFGNGLKIYSENGGSENILSEITPFIVFSDHVEAANFFVFQNKTASWTYDSSLGKYVLTAEE